MAGSSFESGLELAAAAFQKNTGHAVKITCNLDENVSQRLKDGEVFDVVVTSGDAIKGSFLPFGLVEEGGSSIGRAGLGITVRPAAPIPDISSVAALKRATLEAEAVLFTKHTSGLYIETMLKNLGIYEMVEAKIMRFPNGPDLVDRVLAGSGREFGFLSTCHIQMYADKGLVLVGPLPDEVQYFRDFIAVPASSSTNKKAAWEFVRFCGGPGKSLFAVNGLI